MTLQIATDILQEPGLCIFRVEPVGFYLSKYMTSHPAECNSNRLHILPLICKPTQSFEKIFSLFQSILSITFGLFARHRNMCVVPRAGQRHSGCHLLFSVQREYARSKFYPKLRSMNFRRFSAAHEGCNLCWINSRQEGKNDD